MKTKVLPAALFPSVSWFLQGIRNGEFVVGIGGFYQKQSHFNRYTIPGPNGMQNLIIPINHIGERKTLAEATISQESKWQREHTHALNCAYNKAPFYEFYDYRLQNVFDNQGSSLLDLIKASIFLLHAQFRLPQPLVFVASLSDSIDSNSREEYPQVFEEKHGFRAPASALDLLFNLGPEASDYLEKNAGKIFS